MPPGCVPKPGHIPMSLTMVAVAPWLALGIPGMHNDWPVWCQYGVTEWGIVLAAFSMVFQ